MYTDLAKIPARYIKGVGPDRARLLKRLGINTVQDAFEYFPRRYEDRSDITPIKDIVPGTFQTIKARIVSSGVFKTRKGINIFQLGVSDGTASLYCLWFRQPYMKRCFQPDDTLILYGRIQKTTRLQIIHPEYEIIRGPQGREETIHTGRIVPIYPLASGVNQRSLRRIIKNGIDQYLPQFDDILPEYLISRHKLFDIRSAINNIHFPADEGKRLLARRRIVFDEFLILQLALALRRRQMKSATTLRCRAIDLSREKEFFTSLDFEPTGSQTRVMEDIKSDVLSPRPMHRLVQGEVGSGKTVVSAYAMFLSCACGRQAAIMVPTEILARQHYIILNRLFARLGISTALLINDMSGQEKRVVLEGVKRGDIDIVIGTHALIQKGVEFNQLGMVVIDEQHKFGVEQRAALKIKNNNPDMLIMTATPIPRTLAMTLYGDMDISVIDAMPHGKRNVKTMWVDSSRVREVYDFVKRQLALGGQAYIIYPVIEASSAVKSEGAAAMFEKLSSTVFKDFRLGLMHGRLDEAQKTAVMSDFRRKKIDALIATTIVEVGIDVPNASVMVIENAQRFGLSQLHQLRGRVGRGKDASFCVLVADTTTDEARQRLEAISRIDDGFEIAREDLNIRGPGALFGKQQHGAPLLALGNIISDVDILEQARHEAFGIISSDPGLKDPCHKKMRLKLMERFKDKFYLGLTG
ncbi:MAG: ATP-dependent DNA helicase RecG [Candidatus Omnitrophota bacterium]